MSDLKVPNRRFYGEASNFMVSSILTNVDILERSSGEWNGRRVMGYKLPEWQRQEVWTDKQCVDFIESIYLGANIGSFMVNMSFKNPDVDNVLVDGQQRLRAIERYVNNEIAIEGEDGVQYFWKDLAREEQARFHRISFPCIITKYDDENLVKEAYDRHNFSGTPHSLDQKAGGEGYRQKRRP